ncbi:YkgJ family cysteine cluster protein [Williamwhitmania taraxaci]|uniref:Zinc-or iron-chelating domain-containing protein n=1 Tax=Williamwhitmania taraxaci TaxID=1640674 RepID=A0A1G6LBY0_9BACT|nr:YkgJ family cysteine cluster protein [Williamwhitmania taraxaci]SDC40245.1 hypothetical protein SAMN05216323_10303 [Williamwhitmania taraxaci]
MLELESLKERADKEVAKTKLFFQRLKKRKPTKLDGIVQELHEEAFDRIDCLDCANCCKSISPSITDRDIDRMAKELRIRPSEVISRYLYLDSDGDYVYKCQPCPFLMADNYCSIYESRPKACREYPHTDRRKFDQLLDLTIKNTYVCPAAFHIVEQMKKHPGLL